MSGVIGLKYRGVKRVLGWKRQRDCGIGQVGGTANGVADASGQLSSAAEQAGQATQGITDVSQQVAKGAADQTESAQTTTTDAMKQPANAIDQITQSGQEPARGVYLLYVCSVASRHFGCPPEIRKPYDVGSVDYG